MIKYICLSDLHAGALTSLLTDRHALRFDPSKPSKLTRLFGEAFGDFAKRGTRKDKKPQLILLGDALELQFTSRHEATTSALTFLSELSPHLDPEVIATAGNHDHALWTDARLNLHATQFRAAARANAMPEYREATRAFKPDGAQCALLNALLEAAGFGSCDFRYPNIGFEKNGRVVVLHHGHFAEDLYRLMSILIDAFDQKQRKHLSVAEISSENGGWLDFMWSAMGEMHGAGRKAEWIYQNFLTTTGSRKLTKQIAAAIADALGEKLPMAGNLTVRETLHRLTLAALDSTTGAVRDAERYAEVLSLSTEGVESLKWYLEGPCLSQIKTELLHTKNDGKPQRKLKALPEDITFVFGHTHKPFANRIAADGYRAAVKVYNTGGWTLNGPRLDNAEGAGMVVIDENLNTCIVRLFSTPHNGKIDLPKVEILSDRKQATDFAAQVQAWLDASPDLWSAVRDEAIKAYIRRRDYLLRITEDRSGLSKEAAE